MSPSNQTPPLNTTGQALLKGPGIWLLLGLVGTALSLMCLLAMQWYGVSSEHLGFGVAWAIIFAIFGLLAHARAESRLVKYFFLFGAFHFSIGFFAAYAATADMYVPPSTLEAYKTSVAVLGVGFIATCLCFLLGRRSKRKIVPAAKPIDEHSVVNWFSALAVSGLIVAVYVFAATGIVPLLSDYPLIARYLGSGETTPELVLLHNSTMLFLTSMPLLLFVAVRRRSFPLGILLLASTATVALCAQRATLVNVALVCCGLIATVKPGRLKLAFLLGGFAALFYLTMEAAMGGFTESPLAVYGKALGEVRDFALLMLQMGQHNFMWGKTYLAAFVPLPLTLSTFRADNNIIAFTVRTLALPESVNYAGIRMTIYGEGYANFGILGSVGVGLFYGWLVSKLDARLAALQESCGGDIVRAYPMVLPATLLLTAIFLSSTNAIWNLLLKPTILVWLIHWLVSRKMKTRSLPVAGENSPTRTL